MSKTILVADDEMDILMPTVVRLRKAGYLVLTALNGDEALSLARKSPPDLMILDVHMPGLRGPDVIKEIRADSALRNKPVILMTASADHASLENLQALDIQAFLVKPFESNQLFEALGRLLPLTHD